jgi:magnesium transporter
MVATLPDRDTTRPSAGIRAVLYDADGSDREVEVGDISLDALKKHQLLWVDVQVDGEDGSRALLDPLGLEQSDLERATKAADRPRLDSFDDFFRLTLIGVDEAEDRPFQVHALVGENWVVTAHEPTFDLLASFNGPLKGETDLGELDGAVFLATLVNWLLNGYYHLVEHVEELIDELDEKLLAEDVEKEGEESLLAELVAARRRITRLRRVLAPHRDPFAILAQPDSNAFTPAESAATYQRLYERLEKAIDSLDNAREMLVGSFEILMTQTAQRTNDVVKVLTVVSVLLLPAIVIAGIMGMNFKVDLFNVPGLFWVTIAGMVALAIATLAVVRWRHWI